MIQGICTLCLILSSIFISKAQSSSSISKSIYFDVDSYENNIEKNFSSLLANKNACLNMSDAQNQMVQKSAAIVELSRVEKKEKKLGQHELAENLRNSTVTFLIGVDCGNCSNLHILYASGYILSEDGIVATNYHVVEGYLDTTQGQNVAMAIGTVEGKVYLVTEILSTDEDGDLAIVKVDMRDDILQPLAIGDPALQGDEVFAMSHPYGLLYYFSKGTVVRNYTFKEYNSHNVLLPSMDITADYAGGSSGGPIVDIYGNLVATVSTTQSIFYNPRKSKKLQMVVKQTKPIVLLNRMIKLK